MGNGKTSKLNLLFASASLAALLGGIAYVNNSDVLTDVEGATDTVTRAGYKPVTVGGYSPLGCQRGEWLATGFSATNASGQAVTGTVCKTLFGAQRLSFH